MNSGLTGEQIIEFIFENYEFAESLFEYPLAEIQYPVVSAPIPEPVPVSQPVVVSTPEPASVSS